jgi:glycosyltransferase involved in cell wall biosynthesis
MGLDPQKKAIGIVGRLVKGKGHHFFIRLSKALSEIREDLEFLIIGDGPLADEIRLNIKQMNMDGNIKMLGFRSDVIDYINCLDILTLCSDHEGIPYVVLEALKCRTPIVSTNVGGIPEVISSGYNGILTGHGDCEEMKSKILELLDRPSMLNMITQNGYDTLLNKFSTPKMAQETVALYRKILSEKGEKND